MFEDGDQNSACLGQKSELSHCMNASDNCVLGALSFRELASNCWTCLPDHRVGSWPNAESISFFSNERRYLKLEGIWSSAIPTKVSIYLKCDPQTSVQTLVKGPGRVQWLKALWLSNIMPIESNFCKLDSSIL